MTGIYLIKNLMNGNEYIGQSVDIARRFMEHKTPRATGNDKLHKDIRTLGKEQFEFSVLEECDKDKLLEREDFYIKQRNPYYNFVGNRRTDTEKRLISARTKEWWENLPAEKKQEIISNNLTGPRKGHQVSEVTRKKISAGVHKAQLQRVYVIETGEVYESVGALEKLLGACTGTCAAYWRGKIKSVKGFHVEKCRD